MSATEKRIIKVIIDKLGVTEAELTHKANFTEDLGVDSLDAVELKMELEKEFELSIPEEEAIRIKTVGDVINYLISQVG